MPFRLGSASPKPSQARRALSGDHWAHPRNRSGYWVSRLSEVKTPLSKSRTPSNIAILVPSHDHWPASELLASRLKSVPSGSTVKVCSSPVAKLSARLIRILPLVPRGLADAELA